MSEYFPELLETTELRKTTTDVLDHLYKILVRSYGPLGENTIIHRNGDSPSVTKDGLTILKAIKFQSRQEFDIYSLVRSISASLVEKVGDGSTSAVLCARNLYTELKTVRDSYPNSRKFNKALQDVQDTLELVINHFLTRKVSSDLDERTKVLTQIAGISNNNDFDIGGSIAGIMKLCTADSLIRIKDHPSENAPVISFTSTNGFSLDKYRLSHGLYFTGPKTKHGFEVDNALIVMSYNFLTIHYNLLLQKVIPSMTNKVVPIVVIAETIQKEVADQINIDAFKAIAAGNVPAIILVETGGLSTIDSMNTFADLQAYVNANAGMTNIISEENKDTVDLNQIIGYAVKTHFLPNGNIAFDQGAGYKFSTKQFTDQLAYIQGELDSTPVSQRANRGYLRGRLARMNSVNATIFVGGRTQEEKESTKYLVEDSVAACQSVLRNGYTIGGNHATYYAAELLWLINVYVNQRTELSDDPELEEIIQKLDIDWNIVYALIAAYKSTINIPWKLESLSNVVANNSQEYLSAALKDLSFSKDACKYALFNTSNETLEHFDTVSDTVETSVISPVSTDIEIMRATFSIVTLLLTSNQYIA